MHRDPKKWTAGRCERTSDELLDTCTTWLVAAPVGGSAVLHDLASSAIVRGFARR
jgi:hypothetical protein